MPDRSPDRRGPAVPVALVALVLVGAVALSTSSIVAATVSTQPDDATGSETTVPAPPQTDTPETDSTQVVETAPEATGSAADVATTPGPSGEVVGADPDPDTGDVALVAIVGLVLVLSLAAWWMARRDDERPVPDPPPPSGDLI
jgi:hypothetical protein